MCASLGAMDIESLYGSWISIFLDTESTDSCSFTVPRFIICLVSQTCSITTQISKAKSIHAGQRGSEDHCGYIQLPSSQQNVLENLFFCEYNSFHTASKMFKACNYPCFHPFTMSDSKNSSLALQLPAPKNSRASARLGPKCSSLTRRSARLCSENPPSARSPCNHARRWPPLRPRPAGFHLTFSHSKP